MNLDPSVIAIGLDAASWDCITRWSEAGKLPNFRDLISRGTHVPLRHIDYYTDDTPWINFLTGCLPQQHGFWSPLAFDPDSYQSTGKPYEFDSCAPFYADTRPTVDADVNTVETTGDVAIFDVPHCNRLFPNVRGLQLLGWGSHAPMGPLKSEPPELAAEIIAKYGTHPGRELEYSGSWLSRSYLEKFQSALLESIERKTAICVDLIARCRWRLFLAVFSETHMALHKFWHLSDPTHPLYSRLSEADWDPMFEIYRGLDRALGEIRRASPADSELLIFACHGSGGNVDDLASLVFLPELLYRHSFPDKGWLFPRNQYVDTQTPPIEEVERQDWLRGIWRGKAPRVSDALALGKWGIARRIQKRSHGEFSWQPGLWLQRAWPKMKAFALPTFGDGCIRINLRGRERAGIVAPEDYDALCDELCDVLGEFTNPRTGEPLVEKIVRTRADSLGALNGLPDADLVVVWRSMPSDMAEHPRFGRMGPVAFRETGGHRPNGFLLATGTGIPADTRLELGEVTDLAPTLLSRAGLTRPDHLTGTDLLAGAGGVRSAD